MVSRQTAHVDASNRHEDYARKEKTENVAVESKTNDINLWGLLIYNKLHPMCQLNIFENSIVFHHQLFMTAYAFTAYILILIFNTNTETVRE